MSRPVYLPQRLVLKHYGPGPHPGTGSTQDEAHGHGGKEHGKYIKQEINPYNHGRSKYGEKATKSEVAPPFGDNRRRGPAE